MTKNPDINEAVRFVDDFMDKDPKTRDSCPGKINKHKLIVIGYQKERRLLIFKRIKHIIYREATTRNIWYKNSECNPGVVMMGFSLSRLALHPNAVTMEKYAEYFLDISNADWLERNNYVLK